MHFVTFVAVDVGDYPICEQADKAIKEKLDELSKMTEDTIPARAYLKCSISQLNSLTNSFARAVDSAVERRLEPYCECTDDEEYLEFIDETEDVKTQYANGVDCIKLSNGKIVPAWKLNDKFCIKNGLVYQKKWGPLKHDKRTKKAKRMVALPNYPFKRLYKTCGEFADDYLGLRYDEEKNAYGYYCNPNSFWDWYRIGGRWPCNFLVKEDCEEYAPGNYDVDEDLPSPPKGYKWASAARKKDIRWQALIDYEKKRMAERFEFYLKAFEEKELPKDAWYLKLEEDGIYNYCKTAVYLNGETLEENLRRRGFLNDSDFLTLPCYYVDDEYWHCENTSDGTDWKAEVKKFYNSLSDETVLVSVDCHD